MAAEDTSAKVNVDTAKAEAAAAGLAQGRALYIKGEMQNAADALSAALTQL
jgi:hypothetical protein